MQGIVAGIVAAALGGVLAVVGTMGLVSSQSSTPPVVDAPIITYDG